MFERLSAITDFQWLLLVIGTIMIWSLGRIIDLLRSIESEARKANEHLDTISLNVHDSAIDTKEQLSVIAARLSGQGDYR